jgi:arylsulfatase
MDSRSPNIVWFMTDQHRADAMGCAGNPIIQTPHLDRLATEGLRFERCYVTNPVCMPSRASLFTGRYPHAHGSWKNGVELPLREVTLPAVLTDNGYATAAIGKVHLANTNAKYEPGQPLPPTSMHRNKGIPEQEVARFWRSWHGPHYGFQYCELAIAHGNRVAGGGHYGEWLREHHPEAVNLMEPEHAMAPLTGAIESWKSAIPADLHYNTWIAERSVAFLESQRHGQPDRPFFLYCSFPDPHRPMCPPAPYCDMYEPAIVPLPTPNRGELERMPPHHQLSYSGRLRETPYAPTGIQGTSASKHDLSKLPEAHLREMTAHYYGSISLVDDSIGRVLDALDRLGLAENTIVLYCSDHGELMGDHGLIFKGPFHYESMIRTPLIWRWPGVVPAGRTYEHVTSAVDIMPALLQACDVPPEPGVQGESMLPALRGEAGPYREWALVEHREEPQGMQTKTLVTERYKVTYYPGHPFGELFDLYVDPQEYQNLWDVPDYRALRGELLEKLLEALCRTEDPLPEPTGRDGG